MNAKPKTELNSFVFIQKRCNVNGALYKNTCMRKLTLEGIIDDSTSIFNSCIGEICVFLFSEN